MRFVEIAYLFFPPTNQSYLSSYGCCLLLSPVAACCPGLTADGFQLLKPFEAFFSCSRMVRMSELARVSFHLASVSVHGGDLPTEPLCLRVPLYVLCRPVWLHVILPIEDRNESWGVRHFPAFSQCSFM